MQAAWILFEGFYPIRCDFFPLLQLGSAANRCWLARQESEFPFTRMARSLITLVRRDLKRLRVCTEELGGGRNL